MSKPSKDNIFLRDIETLREQARKSLDDGALTVDYPDADASIELLQSALATEIVCVLRYTANSITVAGLSSKSVAAEFAEHAKEESHHMKLIAERIDELGGKPNFNPEGILTRAASQFYNDGTLVDMLRENLVAERIAVEHYRDLIKYFAGKDPSTRLMLEKILQNEEEHAADMHDLLVAHEGEPMLK